jgi:hypothetical protein
MPPTAPVNPPTAPVNPPTTPVTPPTIPDPVSVGEAASDAVAAVPDGAPAEAEGGGALPEPGEVPVAGAVRLADFCGEPVGFAELCPARTVAAAGTGAPNPGSYVVGPPDGRDPPEPATGAALDGLWASGGTATEAGRSRSRTTPITATPTRADTTTSTTLRIGPASFRRRIARRCRIAAPLHGRTPVAPHHRLNHSNE